MKQDHPALANVAQSIAATENRLTRLRDRVQRRKAEGSDTGQTEDMARAISFKLGQPYTRKSIMRRRNWIVRQHDAASSANGFAPEPTVVPAV